ncbi:hypothetical protein SBDP1_70004 [Syntrophobacter sp. SbD1]|nr:hypothetical protein SBDP1_70004 [Syntrophobacter sp. SbD1]
MFPLVKRGEVYVVPLMRTLPLLVQVPVDTTQAPLTQLPQVAGLQTACTGVAGRMAQAITSTAMINADFKLLIIVSFGLWSLIPPKLKSFDILPAAKKADRLRYGSLLPAKR